MPAVRARRRVAVLTALAVLVVAAAAVVGYVVWPRGSEFERAAALLPDDTLRLTWTDWAGLRDELDVDDPAGAGAADFQAAMDERDLGVSPTAASADALDTTLGFSPLAADWEILGQGRGGMVDIIKLPDDVDLGNVADRYADAGFTEPDDDAMSGGVWRGGPDVVTRLPGLEGPELQHVAFLEDDHLLLTSDNADYLGSAVPFAAGEEDGLDLSDLAGHAGDPLAAVALATDLACEELTMSHADEDAQARRRPAHRGGRRGGAADRLPGRAGDRAVVTIVFDFENDDQAEENVRSRGALAAAEDPGQFVEYTELFSVDEVEADGHTVVLTGEATPDNAPLSNLTSGPVLLAAC